MSGKLLLFGNNKFSTLMMRYIKKYTDYDILGFCVDREYMSGTTYASLPNYAFDDLSNHFCKEEIEILICIGNNKMNDIRKSKYNDIKKNGYKIAQFIHPTAHLETDDLGEGNIILENVSVGMGVSIGNCNIFWNGCNLAHDAKIGDFNYIAPATFAGNVSVGNNCFIGVGAAIRSGITIQDYTMVGAGCYLNNSTEPYDVFVPARSVKLNRKSIEMPIS